MPDSNHLSDQIHAAIVKELKSTLEQSLVKIRNCLAQLSLEQIWWRQSESQNSIGNLILHICGNLKQWINGALTDEIDRRDRASEFSNREKVSASQLDELLKSETDTAIECINRASSDAWTKPCTIQKFEVTVLGAVMHTVIHFSGHVQQIILLTRLQLGDDYKFAWTPDQPRKDLPI